MSEVQVSEYGEAIGRVLGEARLAELGPGRENVKMYESLKELTVSRAFAGREVRNQEMAQACLAGLWLYHDYLDRSHEISQALPSTTGSYWHGIMHRREPDYSNAKYWFRKVGRHAVFDELAPRAAELAREASAVGQAAFLAENSEWDPFAFIDLCEACARENDAEMEMLCRQIADREWWLLFDFSFRRAVGA